MPSNNIANNSFFELNKILDLTINSLKEDRLDSINELITAHDKIMNNLRLCEEKASDEHHDLLLKSIKKTNIVVELIKEKSKVIKKQLLTNANRQMINKNYLQKM